MGEDHGLRCKRAVRANMNQVWEHRIELHYRQAGSWANI
jgi:hypothetical protein